MALPADVGQPRWCMAQQKWLGSVFHMSGCDAEYAANVVDCILSVLFSVCPATAQIPVAPHSFHKSGQRLGAASCETAVSINMACEINSNMSWWHITSISPVALHKGPTCPPGNKTSAVFAEGSLEVIVSHEERIRAGDHNVMC